MALKLQDQPTDVGEVSGIGKGGPSAVVAEFRGVTGEKITEMRKAGRGSCVNMGVCCNLSLITIWRCRRRGEVRSR